MNRFVNVPDEDLIVPFKNGDNDAIHELVGRYRKKIRTFSVSLLS